MDVVDNLLMQYPGPVRVRGSRRYWFGGVVACAALMAGAVIKVDGGETITGWATFIFFGLCAAGCIATVAFDLSELILDGDGFTIHLGRTRNHWKWTEVSDFAVVPHELVPFMKNVGFNYRKGEWGPLLKMLDRSNQPFQWRSRSFFDHYGLSKADCVRLLTEWQQRALSAPHP